MSIPLLIVGVFCSFLCLVHVVGGGRDCARPMLDASFDPVAKATVYACWHGVSMYLLASGLLLVWVGLDPSAATRLAAQAIGLSYLCIAALFGVLASTWAIAGGWYKLGQWMAFLPMGIVVLWAA